MACQCELCRCTSAAGSNVGRTEKGVLPRDPEEFRRPMIVGKTFKSPGVPLCKISLAIPKWYGMSFYGML